MNSHFDGGLPFVVYAFPKSNTLNGSFQKDPETYTTEDFSEGGFVFAPFSKDEILVIPDSKSTQISFEWEGEEEERISVHPRAKLADHSAYLNLVGKALEAIRQKGTAKIVTSRTVPLPLDSLDIAVLTKRLFSLYPSAFRYIWFHPKSGWWAGATPEVLLTVENKAFRTMSLAGTQTYVPGEPPNWTSKEIEEQQWVTDDIAKRLQNVASIVKVSKTKNHRAGSLVHLRTDFTGVLTKSGSGLAKVVKKLHPTPAVCGVPREVAHNFILNEEGYDREYYTGFLGPVADTMNFAHLFVNLRSMKISEDTAHLYVGGGVTEDSVPEKEWEETQNKMQTMLQVLAPMLSQ
ncbi:isochorismate synthase [Aureisphaera galaxeae]|uniref:isochorismate synthase n=1 Tax=Aureisphaera galaxeae TaxID=1538023 RepID=UPI002350F1F9|nr:isochorismate synthase [Aureisphaera galaxeae]MDC8004636.1 isochorismate synthase [Aureisphaera galaxeae]